MKSVFGRLTKSDNALEAENNDRLPLSKISKDWLIERLYSDDLGTETDLTDEIKTTLFYKIKKFKLSELKEIAKLSHSGEWHHTSKFANETNYYDASDIIDFLINKEKEIDLLLKKIITPKNIIKNDYTFYSGEFGIWEGRTRIKRLVLYRFENAILKGNWLIFPKVSQKWYGKWLPWDILEKPRRISVNRNQLEYWKQKKEEVKSVTENLEKNTKPEKSKKSKKGVN